MSEVDARAVGSAHMHSHKPRSPRPDQTSGIFFWDATQPRRLTERLMCSVTRDERGSSTHGLAPQSALP